MVPHPLGRTGLAVTPIGYGAFKIGRNEKIKYPAAYDLPDDVAAQAILATALDLGINYFDSAPAYGLSEERLGRFLPARRDGLVISTKVGELFERGESRYDFSADAIHASIDASLRQLRADALDIVLLHAHADDLLILRETDSVAALQSAKAVGKAIAIGFSTRTVAAALKALAWADVLMVEYHLHNTTFAPVISAAQAAGVGVVVKKGLGAGHLPPEPAIEFVLGNPGVSSLVLGSLNPAHLRESVAIADRTFGTPPRKRGS